MNRGIAFFALIISFVGLIGCGEGTKKRPPLLPVTGTVNLNGKALPDGEISMLVTGESPTTFDIKDGAFSGKAYAGSNRVEVRAFKVGPPLSTDPEKKPTKVNFLPETYGTKSTLKAEVTAGGANDFKFEVTSK